MVQALEQKQIVLNKTKTVVKITYDEYAENPRDWDMASNWLCFHNRYNLGDAHINKEFNKDDFDNWEEVEDAIKANYPVAFIVPLSYSAFKYLITSSLSMPKKSFAA